MYVEALPFHAIYVTDNGVGGRSCLQPNHKKTLLEVEIAAKCFQYNIHLAKMKDISESWYLVYAIYVLLSRECVGG